MAHFASWPLEFKTVSSPNSNPLYTVCQNRMLRILLTHFVVALLFLHSGSAAPPKDEGPDAEARTALKVRLALEQREFDQLESLASEFREGKTRFLDGSWKLPVFYDAFDLARVSSAESVWELTRTHLEAWGNAKPESATAKIALANWWIAYAWKARGKGWSDTVTPEQWKLLKERLLIAEEFLNIAGELSTKCPARVQMLQRVALGAGWPKERYLPLVEEGMQSFPEYTPIVLEAARYLLPRWYGQPGDWEKFAVKRGSASEFALLAWANSDSYANLFGETEVQWLPLNEGFKELRFQHPDSDWILNNYARFACLAEDRATAKELFALLTERYCPAAWPSQARFEELKTWANGG